MRPHTIIRTIAIIAALLFLAWQIDILALDRFLSLHVLAAIVIVQVPVFLTVGATARRHALLASTPPVPLWVAAKAIILFIGLNHVLPARSAELVKATYIRDKASVPLPEGLTAVIVGQLLDLAMLGVIAMFSFSLVLRDYHRAAIPVSVATVVLALVALMVLPRLPSLLERWQSWRRLPLALPLLERFSDAMSQPRIRENIKIAWMYSLLYWMLSLLTIMIFVQVATDGDAPAFVPLLVFIGAIIGGAIPLLPGGIGTFEIGAMFGFLAADYGFEEALGLAIALRIALMAGAILATGLIMLRERVGLSRLAGELLSIARGLAKKGKQAVPPNNNRK